MVIGAGILHFAIGTVAAIVAKNKGRNFTIWLPLGLFAGTPALIAAWRLEGQADRVSENPNQ
ncbi:hypothetical protein IQ266_01640 [filamentous cyanobacterium LEGE 11480]|uniref:Uncharacterized protein n=1 Tax=Romeriopsis navalis LEGE 11480 TaxID=2777977 RepID=A0A928Z1X3_9CYAN|nr:hypothetical protein [Romeriopsis navalis LEGE 11480]